MGLLLGAAITLLLVLVNGLLASAEIALVGLSESRLKSRAEQGDKKARFLLEMKENPSQFLSTIQIGITLAGLLSGAFAADFFATPIVAAIASLGVTGAWLSVAQAAIVVLITFIITYIMLLFGELVPKRMAMADPQRMSERSAGIISFLSRATKPLVRLLAASTNAILRLLGVPVDQDEPVTDEDVLLMVREGREQGAFLEEEAVVVRNLFAASDQRAADVMTHRTEVQGIPEDIDLEGLERCLRETPFSRYPVYQGDLDHIIGIASAKDLWPMIIRGWKGEEHPPLQAVLRRASYVPETQSVVELLAQMKRAAEHLVIVVDAYGGTSGILSIMDIVQEIVGDLQPEPDNAYEKNADGSYSFSGRAEMEAVLEVLGPLPSLAGQEVLSEFLIDCLGRIPDVRERPAVRVDGFLFAIVEMNGPQIVRVTVSPEGEKRG